MISEAEAVKTKEFLKKRILRLQQVREQSKNFAKKVRHRVENEKGKLISDINADKTREVQKMKEVNIGHLKSQLEEQLSQVGTSHSNALFEDLLKKEWDARKRFDFNKALERGNKAAERLRKSSKTNTAWKKTTSARVEMKPTRQAKSTQNNNIDECGDKITDNFDKNNTKLGPSVEDKDFTVPHGEDNLNLPSNVVTNYFELLPDIENNDFSQRFCPSETIKQLKISQQAPMPAKRGMGDTASTHTNIVPSRESESSQVDEVLNKNQFTTAISDHIKNRPFKSSPFKLISESDTNSDNLSASRNLIEYTKSAAPPLAPSVPKLPASYKREDETSKSAVVNLGRLSTIAEDSPPKHTIQNPCFCVRRKTNRKTFRPDLRQTLKPQSVRKSSSSPSVYATSGDVLYSDKVLRRKQSMPINKPPPHPVGKNSNIGSDDKSTNRYNSPKTIKSFDEATKTEHKTKPSENYLVERLTKAGKTAFELALEENKGARVIEKQKSYNEQARRVRGMAAEGKLQKEKEYYAVMKLIDEYEKKRKSIIPNDANKENIKMYQNEPRRVEKIERESDKTVYYEEPMQSSSAQPQRIYVKHRMVQTELNHSSDDLYVPKRNTNACHKKRSSNTEKSRPPVVNVADLNETSDSNPKIVDQVETKNMKLTQNNTSSMNIDRVLDLIEKQREQLINELAKMENMKKTASKSKIFEKHQGAAPTTAEFHQSPKKVEQDHEKNDHQQKCAPKTKNDVIDHSLKVKKNENNYQLSNGIHNSITFQGFQIVVEVKKCSQLDIQESVLKAEKNVQTTSSLLESQDSSAEVSIKTSRVVATETILYENEDVHLKSNVDSSASTSYMSPPERFSRQAVETYFGKRTTLHNTETQTEIPQRHFKNKISKNLNNRVKLKAADENIQCINTSKEDSGIHPLTQKKISRGIGKHVVPLHKNESDKTLDPKVKGYIHKLLELSKVGIQNLKIDVSDVSTPSSSVIDVSSNIVDYSEKFEKLKHFIDENYSLLEQLKNQKRFHQNYVKNNSGILIQANNEAMSQYLGVHSSFNGLPVSKNKREHDVRLKKPLLKQQQKESCPKKKLSCKQSKGVSTESWLCSSHQTETKHKYKKRKRVEEKDSSDSQHETVNVSETYAAKSQNNEEKYSDKRNSEDDGKQGLEEKDTIGHYKKLSSECSQRIETLSQRLEEVRKSKQITVSSNSSQSSEEDHSIPIKMSSDDSQFTPILSNIPKPSNYLADIGNSHVPIKQSLKTNVCIYDAQNKVLPFPEYVDDGGKRPRPPIAMYRNPIMNHADFAPGTPHELSTIIEVETPAHGQGNNVLPRPTETDATLASTPTKISQHVVDDPRTASPMVSDSVKISHPAVTSLAMSNLNDLKSKDVEVNEPPCFDPETESVQVQISPFISFKDFTKDQGLEKINDILDDLSVKADLSKGSPKNVLSDSEDTLPDVMAEMIKRDLMKNSLNENHSTDGSSESYSSDSSVYILGQTSSHSSLKEHQLAQDLPSISGIDKIKHSASNSSASEQLMNDFENALQTMGIHWAVSTLKKTKESMALSSTSSSVCKESAKNRNNTSEYLIKDFSSISGTSVGLSTLLDELNIPDNSLFKSYAAELSNSSLTKQMDILLNKVAKISRSEQKSKDNTNKLMENKGGNALIEEINISGQQGSSKDKTQHRTSTPVQMVTLSSHYSSSMSSAKHPSNGLFGIESDLSSVKNVTNIEKNMSFNDKDSLNVPELSLKFGKLFDSSNNSCT